MINGAPLEFVPKFKHLGVLITWSHHIDWICAN